MEKDTGKKLKELREKHGLSQEKFADEIGVSRQIVSRWEKGKVIPNVSSVKKICDYYGISTNLLLNTNIPVGEVNEESQPVAKKKNRKMVITKGIAIFLLVISIIYVIYSTYKFFILKDLEEKFKEYDNWTNYYAEIRTVEEARLTGKTEIWYKDNKYKIITENYYEDGRILKKCKYIDVNNARVIDQNIETGTIKENNSSENMNLYKQGIFLKKVLDWPELIENLSIIEMSIKPCIIFCINNSEEDGLIIENKKIMFQHNSAIPSRYINNESEKLVLKKYKVELNSVSDKDIKIEKDL